MGDANQLYSPLANAELGYPLTNNTNFPTKTLLSKQALSSIALQPQID